MQEQAILKLQQAQSSNIKPRQIIVSEDQDGPLFLHEFTAQEDKCIQEYVSKQQIHSQKTWSAASLILKVKTKAKQKIQPSLIQRRWENVLGPAARRRKQRQQAEIKAVKFQEQKQHIQQQLSKIISLVLETGVDFEFISSRLTNRSSVDIYKITKNVLQQSIRALQNLVISQLKDYIYKLGNNEIQSILQSLIQKRKRNSQATTQCRNNLLQLYCKLRNNQYLANSEVIEYYTIFNNYVVAKGIGKKWIASVTDPQVEFEWSYVESKRIGQLYVEKMGNFDEIFEQANKFDSNSKQGSQKYTKQIIKAKIDKLMRSGIQLVTMIAKQKYFFSPAKWKVQKRDFIVKQFMSGSFDNERMFKYIRRVMSINFDQRITRQDIQKLLNFLNKVASYAKVKNGNASMNGNGNSIAK